MESPNRFKAEFKRFKKKKSVEISSKTIIHFGEDYPSPDAWKIVQEKFDTSDDRWGGSRFGLKPMSTWSIYSIENFPGFIYIVDPFIRAPNASNLDISLNPSDRGCLWEKHISLARHERAEVDWLRKLRWVTLGYHYDWDRKIYHKERVSKFPDDLSALSKFIAELFRFPRYQPEAGIVNFYNMDSSIGGHTDHSEYDLTAPLISYSFGQSAVFLLGRSTLDETPVAMRVQSGDIMIMSGESRLAYHAVPMVFAAPLCNCKRENDGAKCFSLNCEEGIRESLSYVPDCAPKDWNPIRGDVDLLSNYLQNTRVNVNVRQVLPNDGKFPD